MTSINDKLNLFYVLPQPKIKLRNHLLLPGEILVVCLGGLLIARVGLLHN